ncbi:hypothetical protein FSP39_007338 [Pinctada imbricata]|uniref:SFR19-like C-terminal domain-containing protein n=1 Tax=Pinctada imbricata TaxID=66713 RepID=A0AA88YQ94_PINIB|nr:hypothetical protein FSP39_007338 [Pinctada imbricata]
MRIPDRKEYSDNSRDKREAKENRVLTAVPPLPESKAPAVIEPPPIPPPVIPSFIRPPSPAFPANNIVIEAQGEYDPAFPTDDMEECSPTPDQPILLEQASSPPLELDEDAPIFPPLQRLSSPSLQLQRPPQPLSPTAHLQGHPVQAMSPLNPQQGLAAPGGPGQGILGEGGTILLPAAPGEPHSLLPQPTHLPIQIRMLPPALQASIAQQQRPVLVNQMLMNRPNPFAGLQRLPPGHPLQQRIGIQVSTPAGIVPVQGLAPRLPPGALPPHTLNGEFDPLHPDAQHPVHFLPGDPRGDPRLHHPAESPFVSLAPETQNVPAPEGIPLSSIASEQINQITKLLQSQAHLALLSKGEQSIQYSNIPLLETPPVTQIHSAPEEHLTLPLPRSEGLLPFPDRPPVSREGLLPTPNLPPMSRAGLLPLPDHPPVSKIDNIFTEVKPPPNDNAVFKVPLLPPPLLASINKNTKIPGLNLGSSEKENEDIGEIDMDITSPLDEGNIEIPTSTTDKHKSSHSDSSEHRRRDRHERHRGREKENSRKSKSKDRHKHREEKSRRYTPEEEKDKVIGSFTEKNGNRDNSMDIPEDAYNPFDDYGGADEIPSSAVELTNKEKYLKKLHLQERVVDEVKTALKPFYHERKIDKEEYKEIMRRCVPKVCHSKSGDINPVKIRNLVEAYVEKFQRANQKKLGISNGERVDTKMKL